MGDSMTGVFLFFMFAGGIAAGVHAKIQNWQVAAVVSATISTILIQTLLYADLGHLDKFFLIGLVVSWFYSCVISCLVAIPFQIARRRRPPPNHCQSCGYNLTGNVSGVCPECGESV